MEDSTFLCAVHYPRRHAAIIKRALVHIEDTVFYHWHVKPIFSIEGWSNEEIKVNIEYTLPGAKNAEETIQGHEALDLAQAFLDGVILAQKLHSRK